MEIVNDIIIHSSDSEIGNAVMIDKWHRLKSWEAIGYHYVIRRSDNYIFDGGIEIGRHLSQMGAHVYGHNKHSIGICLIGKPVNGKCKFTQAQLLSARNLCHFLMKRYNIPVDNVLGHYELDNKKTCPAMDMDLFRKYIASNKITNFADLLDSMK